MWFLYLAGFSKIRCFKCFLQAAMCVAVMCASAPVACAHAPQNVQHAHTKSVIPLSPSSGLSPDFLYCCLITCPA